MALGFPRVTGRMTKPGRDRRHPDAECRADAGAGARAVDGKRVPAMLNYTAGADGLRAACTAAGIKTIVASRGFIEKARLGAVLDQLDGITIFYLEDFKATDQSCGQAMDALALVFPGLCCRTANA
jgi:acyl-[acyl-carrier-protein]-phospholipid O-acyltransferase/long-chain-fatty-acid--[acyl-carrier-protein] ligase